MGRSAPRAVLVALLVLLPSIVVSGQDTGSTPNTQGQQPPIRNISPEEATKRITLTVLPEYPESAKQGHIAGTVDIAVGITPTGEIGDFTRVLVGPPALAQAALAAIRQWKFRPNIEQGKPTFARVRALVRFKPDGTIEVALAPAILPDSFGDPGTPRNIALEANLQPVARSAPAAASASASVSQTAVDNGPARSPAVNTANGPTRISLSSQVEAGKLLPHSEPAYPPAALQARVQGVVVLHAIIDKEGRVSQLQAVSGHPLLAQSALETVKNWRYQPTLLNGQPIEVDTTVSVSFRLSEPLPAVSPTGSPVQSNVPQGPSIVSQLVRQGYSMSSQQANQLENNLIRNPEDVNSRAELLGFYFSQAGKNISYDQARPARLKHILWLVEHHPDSEMLSGSEATIDPGGHPLADSDGYAKAKAAWLEQTEQHKDNAPVQLNAAMFFKSPDIELAADLAKQANSLEPKNVNAAALLGNIYSRGILGVTMTNQNNFPMAVDPELANGPVARKFRQELEQTNNVGVIGTTGYLIAFEGGLLSAAGKAPPDYGDLAERYLLRALATDPSNTGGYIMLNQLYESQQLRAASPEDRIAFANKRLATLEKGLAIDNPQTKLSLLPLAARAAFDAGQYQKAGTHADGLLAVSVAHEQDLQYGPAIHQAHIVLGRVALQQMDVEKAKSELLAAGRVMGGATLSSFGPNMLLAKELLEKGQTDVVLQYLDLCARFWTNDRGQLAKWKSEIQAGNVPNFGPNLNY